MCCRIKTCCCGCPVKSATIVLIWWDLITVLPFFVSAVVGLSAGGIACSPPVVICFIIMLSYAMAFYSITETKPIYLVPYLILRTVSTMLIVILVALILFFEILTVDWFVKLSEYDILRDSLQFIENECPSLKATFSNLSISTVLVEILIIAIEIHLLMVVISCYKELAERAEQRDQMKVPNNYAMASPYFQHGVIRCALTPIPTAPNGNLGIPVLPATAPSFSETV